MEPEGASRLVKVIELIGTVVPYAIEIRLASSMGQQLK